MTGARAGILTVGDELLFGATVDTNGAWLSARLADLGLPVRARAVVGDRDEEIRRALLWLLESVDVVVVTGGLGPTPDDLTRETVAATLGIGLVESAALLSGLVERFRAHGLGDLPPDNARQALEPAAGHGRTFPNPVGSAPGLWFEAPRPVVCLPGPPHELKAIFTASVAPALAARFQTRLDPPFHRMFHTTGIAESVLSARIAETFPEGTGPVGVAFLPHLGSVDVRLTVTGLPAPEATAWLDRLEVRLAPVLAPHRFDSPHGDVAEAVHARLAATHRTLSVAESCTGGRIAHRLTVMPGSSRTFVGGVVAYANEAKSGLLGIDPGLIGRVGAVSREVAEGLATGACRVFGTRAGIGVTGIAGPDGGTDDKPVGTVWYAVALDGAVHAHHRRFLGDRDGIRERASEAALGLLHRLLGDGPVEADG
ncbi:MAG: CinA family nicotinamide mononucleotide deamidase-related protein [Gemmatimonadota bacterium]